MWNSLTSTASLGKSYALINEGCTKIIPNAHLKWIAAESFRALKPIKIGNSVNGALAKTLIISANPRIDYEHL